jgi:hypothetical protein
MNSEQPITPDDKNPAEAREFKPPQYGTIVYDHHVYHDVCLRCWKRILDGTHRFIHPSWLRVERKAVHTQAHRDWLDLTQDEKNCKLADTLGGKIGVIHADGKVELWSADDLRFSGDNNG